MKKIILIILLCILLLEGVALAALSFDETYYMQHLSYVGSGSSVTDPLYLFMNESIGYLEATSAFGSIYFSPTDTAPTASEGMLYYHESDEALKLRTSSAWVDIDVSGASSLGSAYAIGSAITVDTAAITLTTTDAANNVILALVHAETGNFSAMTITNASAYPAIQITGSSTGPDITGTSATWSVSTTGVATLVGADIGNGDLELTEASNYNISLIGDVDGVLTISASTKEDIEFNLVTANTLTITTSTSVDKVNWGDVDEHSGILSITMEGSELATITNIGTGSGDDLVISQATSGQNASLLLTSSGTSTTDALIITASVGTIDLNSADNLDIDVDDEITVNTADGGYALTIAGSSLGDYTLTVADDFSTIVVGSLLLQNTEASSDITVNSVAGSILIKAEEDAANAILIVADGSTSSTLELFNDTGTSVTEGAYSIQLISDLGGIELLTNANLAKAIDIMVDGGTTSSIMVFNDTGVSVSECAASIQLWSDLGGVQLQSDAALAEAICLRTDGGTAETIYIHSDQGTGVCATTQYDASIQLISDDGGIGLYSTANLADAIRIEANGGASETVAISSVKGTGAGSIDLDSLVGGITIETQASGKDILIDSVQGSVVIEGQETGAVNAVLITADGDASTGLKIHNDTGTGANSILLLSDVGGITITASAVATTAKGLVVSGTAATGCVVTEGGGLYASFNSTQNATGLLKAVGFWLDITAGTPTAGASMIALDVGVYQAETGADLTNTTVKVINMEYQGTTSGARDSTSVYWFNFNSAGHHPTAWFHCNGGNNIAFTAETTHSSPNKLGAIAIKIDAINGGNLSYIYVYSDTGN